MAGLLIAFGLIGVVALMILVGWGILALYRIWTAKTSDDMPALKPPAWWPRREPRDTSNVDRS